MQELSTWKVWSVIYMTQEEFAEMIGVSTDTVSKIERGAVLPSIRSMTEIAAVTGKPIEYFLQDHEKRT